MTDLFDIANLITTVGVDGVKIKQEPGLPEKSSNEILTELFSTFDTPDDGVASPLNSAQQVSNGDVDKIDKVSDELQTKRKKIKKKHKHKEKKHKKKSKHDSSDNSDADGNNVHYVLVSTVLQYNHSLFILIRYQKKEKTQEEIQAKT